MNEINVKHFLEGLIYLDTINLEEKLSSSPKTNLFDDNIFIDLSKCQFAELGALTQLILIVETFLKNGHKIFIALPTTNFTTNQIRSSKDLTQIENSLEKQISTNNFIKKAGFVSVLQKLSKICKNEIYFTEKYDYSKKGKKILVESFSNAFSVIFEEIILNEGNYQFLLPFKLIDCEKGISEIKDFENSLEKVLNNQNRGIEDFDVKVIKNVILSELIKNVRAHSQSKYAVFSVGLIKTSSLFFSDNYEDYLKKPGPKRKINPIEYEHLKSVKINKIESQVEIYFGDSGIGLLNERYKEYVSNTFKVSIGDSKNLLKYSFNKWSTTQDNEPRRGTKGLYRLKRIVDKYKGKVHIKTDAYNGGFFNGDFICRKIDSIFNGTLISVRINPFKEVKSFKLSRNLSKKDYTWASEKITVDRELKCIEKIIKKVIKEENLLLIADIGEINLSNESKLLEEFLYEVSFISHPSAIVIYLISYATDIDNDTIDLLIESVQTRINEVGKNRLSPENESPDFEEVHDLVLLFGNNNQTFWYGTNNRLIKIIDESYSKILSSENTSINSLISYQELSDKEKVQFMNYLETDSRLVVLNQDSEIEFNFYGIEKHYESKIINFRPKINNKSICTPKLSVIESWIDISELLKGDEYGFALCLYLKYRSVYESQNGNIDKLDRQNTFILIDHNQQLELTKKFSELLGLKVKNIRSIENEIDFSMPKRTKLFNDNSVVIFLTTIVSSSETIRRMVKYAKRDKAIPEVILCLMNYRKNKISSLETWNENTPIISIFQKFNKELKPTNKDQDYFANRIHELKKSEIIINPSFKEETKEQLRNVIQVEKDILGFIKANKFLHYNHYGQNNKRHFTFYLDKVGILDSVDDIICSKINSAILEWKKEKGITDFTLYINIGLLRQSNYFLDFLNKNYPQKVRAIDIKDSSLTASNSIYFDFGVLTGESITNLINKVESVNNLLVCILFNQSINSNADFFKKIKTLNFFIDSSFALTEESKRSKEVDFEIKYLFDLPLSFFNSENCPICEHRRALDFYTFEEPYFKHFSDDRRERLKQNAPEDILELTCPVDFYYSEKKEERNQELSREIIFQMYEFKILLENASRYTIYRIVLFNVLYRVYNNIEQEIQNSESEIFSIVYFLSFEINWLQNEPLVFRDFRILLSRISLRIATIDFKLLEKYFEKTNKYNIPVNNLVTRYKYSAISVLRSTDKLLFCENVYDIVSSFWFENRRFSNNLLQNTLYHISSFYKNAYNKSELYFLAIENNLNKLLDYFSNYSESQFSAIKFVIEQNKSILMEFKRIGDEPISFKKMKDQWEKLYLVEMPKHPEPYQEFKTLNLNQHYENFTAIKEDSALIIVSDTLKEKIRELTSRWGNVKHYISNNILYYFKEHLSFLVNSDFFKNEYNNHLNPFVIEKQISKLEGILEKMNSDLLEYLNYKEEYDSLYTFLNDNLIIKKGLGSSIVNSKFLELLDEFPLVFFPIINDVFPKIEFPKCHISSYYKNVEVQAESMAYFPKSVFRRHLEFVKENIKQKLNRDAKLEDTIVKFELNFSDNEFIGVKISYDNTCQWDNNPNPNGSLKSFKKHIEDFKGSFNYRPCSASQKYFVLEFKILRYE